MAEGFFDWVYETEEFKQAKEYVSNYRDGRSFEDAISYSGFHNPLFELRDLSKNNIRFYDKILRNVRQEVMDKKLTIGELRKLANNGEEAFLTLPKIGSERAKFLYELFKPE